MRCACAFPLDFSGTRRGGFQGMLVKSELVNGARDDFDRVDEQVAFVVKASGKALFEITFVCLILDLQILNVFVNTLRQI